jgi:F-type H+-transporting ATPase subunit delta
LTTTVSARRYAQAIFQIAEERSELDKWRGELGRMTDILKVPELASLLEAAKIPFPKKQQLLKEALAGLSPLALNLGYLLVSRGKLRLIESIHSEYNRLVDESYQVEHIAVTTAVPLDEKEKEQLSQRFSRAIGKKVVLETSVAPSILGGLVAKVGNTILDGSTRNALNTLRKELAGSKT